MKAKMTMTILFFWAALITVAGVLVLGDILVW